jgi:glyoxylase I family protein
MTNILSARHTGLVVKDLEVSLAFYRDFLGLELTGRAREEGPYIEDLVGIPGAVLDWAKLKTPGGHLVELLQYVSHPSPAEPEELGRASRPGCSHLAFTVADIDALFEVLAAAGHKCNHAPQFSPDGKVKVMYAHDPDGIILELVQELK